MASGTWAAAAVVLPSDKCAAAAAGEARKHVLGGMPMRCSAVRTTLMGFPTRVPGAAWNAPALAMVAEKALHNALTRNRPLPLPALLLLLLLGKLNTTASAASVRVAPLQRAHLRLSRLRLLPLMARQAAPQLENQCRALPREAGLQVLG